MTTLTLTRNQGMDIVKCTHAHRGKITMTKLQAIGIVNDTFAYKNRFGKLPINMIWKGIDDNHRCEAFRIAKSIVDIVQEEDNMKKVKNTMCIVKPSTTRRKVIHCEAHKKIRIL